MNLITNIVLEGQIYFIMYNLTSRWLEPQLRILQKVMSSREILENTLPITSFNLKR